MMRILISACLLMVPAEMAMAAAQGLPALNIEATCKATEKVGNLGLPGSYETCLTSERSARAEIERGWASFDAASRKSCVAEDATLLPSYVDILTCLQMNMKDGMPKSGGIK